MPAGQPRIAAAGGAPDRCDAGVFLGGLQDRVSADALLFLAAPAPKQRGQLRRPRPPGDAQSRQRGWHFLAAPPGCRKGCSGGTSAGRQAACGATWGSSSAGKVGRWQPGWPKGPSCDSRQSCTVGTGPDPPQAADAYIVRYGGRLLGGAGEADPEGEDRVQQAQQSWQEFLIRCLTACDGILDGCQPILAFYILKDEFLLSPVDISLTVGLYMVPWVLKPLLAACSDRVPIFGRRRTPYLAVSMLVIAGTFTVSAMAKTYWGFVGGMALSMFGRCLQNAVMQGMVVELGRPQGVGGTTKVVADFYLFKTAGALVSAFASSMLITQVGARAVLGSAPLLPASVLVVIGLYEAFAPRHEAIALEDEVAWSGRWERFSEMLRQPSMWGSLVFILIYNAGPNCDDSLYYYYIERLHFQPDAIGRLKMAQELAKLLGIALYRFALRKLPDQKLLVYVTSLSFPCYLTPLLLTTGAYHALHINPQMLAISGELVREVFMHLQVMPTYSRWVQVCPEGLEGTVTAVLLSTVQISRAISKASSAGAAALFGVTSTNFSNLSLLILVCGGFCLAPLPLAGALPAGRNPVTAAAELAPWQVASVSDDEGDENGPRGMLELTSPRASSSMPPAG